MDQGDYLSALPVFDKSNMISYLQLKAVSCSTVYQFKWLIFAEHGYGFSMS